MFGDTRHQAMWVCQFYWEKDTKRKTTVWKKDTPMSKVEISPVGRWAPNQVQRLRLQPMVNGHWPYMGVDQKVR